MHFTEQDYRVMISQLAAGDERAYDGLYHIATEELMPSIISQCKRYDCLRGEQEDILHDVYIILTKTIVTRFLCRPDDEKTDKSAEGFSRWMHTTTNNYIITLVRKRRCDVPIDDVELSEPSEPFTPRGEEEAVETLREALNTVLNSDTSVHIVLTFFAEYVYVLTRGVNRMEATDWILFDFSQKTLDEMYKMIMLESEAVPWLVVTGAQHERIMSALRKPTVDGRRHGRLTYAEYFMKYNGETNGKKSVSEWVGRMNKLVARKGGKPKRKSPRGADKDKKDQQSKKQ